MANSRRIDRAPAPPAEPKDIQVLCLGFSRTALKHALTTLGYTPYHMSEAIGNARLGDMNYWNEAIDAKYLGKGELFRKEDFNKFLYKYDVLEDIPSILFVDEFLAMYPKAKVILTNRDIESWSVSMDKTFFEVLSWRTLPILYKLDKVLWGVYMPLVCRIVEIWTGGNPSDKDALRQTFVDHYAHVRKVVPRDNVLEFQSKDGWEPLCRYLGKEVPEEPYPRVNDATYTRKIHSFLYYFRIWQLVKKPLGAAVAVTVAGGAWYWYGLSRLE